MQDYLDTKATVLEVVHCYWHVQLCEEEARQLCGH